MSSEVVTCWDPYALFLLAIVIFSSVIATFVRWVDRLARLGLLGTTIQRSRTR
jgi:hypothetical protein